MELSLATGRQILDAAAVDARHGTLLVLDDTGALVGVDTGSGAQTVLCRIELPAVPVDRSRGVFPRPRVRLHAADDGSVVVVATDAGTEGLVVETATGRTTMRITAVDHHAETVELSVAVLRHRGRQVVLHRTAWNRLDASDALTGALLTERAPAASDDGARSERDLDYFHGPLAVNRSGTRVADGGWVWHPVGVLRAWSLAVWLEQDPWEPEDGPSAVDLLLRDDWNLPMVWLDEDHLAVAGLAGWDREEFEETDPRPGVRVIDVREPERSGDRLLPAPAVPERLLADGSALVTVDVDGTSVREPVSGDLLRHWPDLRATALDRVRREVVAVRGDRIVTRAL
ncbi:MAG TPA: hypothetical protein VGC67_15305 [Cellulomonas sp.]